MYHILLSLFVIVIRYRNTIITKRLNYSRQNLNLKNSIVFNTNYLYN